MRILILESESDAFTLVSLALQSSPDCAIEYARRDKDAHWKLRKEGPFDAFLCPQDCPQSTVEYVLNGSSPESTPQVVRYGSDPALVSNVLGLKPEAATDDHRYCRVSLSSLLRFGSLDFDVWTTIGQSKYVRLMKCGDKFDMRDRIKYESKGWSYLLVRNEDAKKFLGRYAAFLSDITRSRESKIKGTLKLTTEALELLHSVTQELSVGPEVTQATEAIIDFTLEHVRKGGSEEIVRRLTDPHQGFIAEHSAALAHLCCLLAYKVRWTSDLTLKKLVASAFLHDMSLPTDDLARIQGIDELGMAGGHFTTQDRQKWMDHAQESSKLSKDMGLDTEDSDKIILQHHERPDGTGLYRLGPEAITPLAALFIMAEDILHYFYANKGKANLRSYFKDRRGMFWGGPFRLIAREAMATIDAKHNKDAA